MHRSAFTVLLLAALAFPAAAGATLKTSRYLVTISSRPTLSYVSGQDPETKGFATADWTGRWFVKMFSDRERSTAAFKAVAKPATRPSKSKSTFVGTAQGSFRDHLYGTEYRDCNWTVDAKTALHDVSLTGSGLDGLVGGTRRSYKRTKVIGMWLEASGPTETSFGQCMSSSGTGTARWSRPSTAFLDEDQCVFGSGRDFDGLGNIKSVKIGFSSKHLGAKLIKSKATGYPAEMNGVLGSCSPFGEQFAAGGLEDRGDGADLHASYVFEMQRLQ